jgi:hypothetical protein
MVNERFTTPLHPHSFDEGFWAMILVLNDPDEDVRALAAQWEAAGLGPRCLAVRCEDRGLTQVKAAVVGPVATQVQPHRRTSRSAPISEPALVP